MTTEPHSAIKRHKFIEYIDNVDYRTKLRSNEKNPFILLQFVLLAWKKDDEEASGASWKKLTLPQRTLYFSIFFFYSCLLYDKIYLSTYNLLLQCIRSFRDRRFYCLSFQLFFLCLSPSPSLLFFLRMHFYHPHSNIGSSKINIIINSIALDCQFILKIPTTRSSSMHIAYMTMNKYDGCRLYLANGEDRKLHWRFVPLPCGVRGRIGNSISQNVTWIGQNCLRCYFILAYSRSYKDIVLCLVMDTRHAAKSKWNKKTKRKKHFEYIYIITILKIYE